MKQKKSKLIPLLFFSCGIMGVNAQKNVLSTGGDASGVGGKVSYSIGQIDYIAVSNAGGSVLQGVQHPFAPSLLPITLLNFKAIRQEQKVLLDWQTATEINSYKFIIQRSRDGISFFDLSEKAAAGNSNIQKQYTAEDLHPLSGWNYYRLKQVDKDGSVVYSKVAPVNFNLSDNIAVIYPNPTKQNVTLKITGLNTVSYSYRLYDAKGDVVLSNKITNSETNIRVSKLSAGSYYLKIIDQSNKTIKTFQIIKSN